MRAYFIAIKVKLLRNKAPPNVPTAEVHSFETHDYWVETLSAIRRMDIKGYGSLKINCSSVKKKMLGPMLLSIDLKTVGQK